MKRILKLDNYIKEYSVKNKNLLNYPVYSVSNEQGFCQDYFSKEVASKDKSTYKIVPYGYFAYNPSRINVGSVDWQNKEENVIVSPLYVVFSVNNEIRQPYLYYYLKSDVIKHFIKAYSTGSVRDNLKFSILKDFPICVPSLSEQDKVVKTLDKVKYLINLSQNELAKLDELVKARFVEMFGDPIINSKGLRETEFVNVVMLQRGFDLPTKERSANGTIPVYGSNGVLDYHSLSRCENGIITGRSGTIGQVYYCKGEFWPLNTTLFSIKTYCNNIIYLTYLLKFFKLERFYNGTGVPTLNRNIVHKQKIIDVPIELQNEFAEFVEQVEKSKKGIQQSLEKLETLKKSLMQEYFG